MITLRSLTCTIRGLAFSPTGEHLAAIGTTGCVIWDTAGHGTELARPPLTGYSLAFTPDGASIATIGSRANLWAFSTGEVSRLPADADWYAHTCYRICVRPNGSQICVAGVFRIPDAMDVTRWALPEQRKLESWSGDETTGGIAFSPDGTVLAAAYDDHRETVKRIYTVLLRDPDEGTVRTTLGGSTAPITDLVFSPDGSSLASIAGITLRVWDVTTGEEVAARKVGSKHFEGFAFTPDGRSLLTVSNDKTVRVWETDTWTETSAYEWKIGKATAIAVAPDGLRAAVGGSTGKVILFDLDE